MSFWLSCGVFIEGDGDPQCPYYLGNLLEIKKTCYEFFFNDFLLSNSGRCLSIDLLDVGQIPPGQNSFGYNPKDKISFLISIVQLNIYIAYYL